MDLRARLRDLESRLGVGQRTPAEANTATAHAELAGVPDASPAPFAARLQRLAAIQPAASSRRAVTPEHIARLLDGSPCADGVVLVERLLPMSHSHGRVPFAGIRESSLRFLAGGAEPEREKLLFIDTETTGLAGGTGTVAFVLGLARLRGDTVEVRQYFLTCFGGEAAMLTHALEWISADSHLVSFNGKSFDVPLLATRYRMARLADPLSGLPHIDLLHRTRAAYRRNWPDCRLQTAEKFLLKLFRDDDVPGHLIPQIWTDLLQHGETAGLRGVVDHNRLDVLTLIALAGVLGRTYAEPGQDYADPLGIARAHRRAGDADSALRHLQDHGGTLTADAQMELAGLHARSGRWDSAVPLWEALARNDVPSAMERLAIYNEHHQRDYDSALRWTDRMTSLMGQYTARSTSIEQRRARLLRKLAKLSPAPAKACSL